MLMSIYIEEPTFPEATHPCLREVAGAPSPGGEVNADALMAHIMLKENSDLCMSACRHLRHVNCPRESQRSFSAHGASIILGCIPLTYGSVVPICIIEEGYDSETDQRPPVLSEIPQR